MSGEIEYSVNLLRRMLEIYSPSGREEEISLFLAGEMEKMGFNKVWMDNVGNVYGEIGSGNPTILLCGHMDTVPGWIPVRIEGDRIYGRGAVDAKSALSAIVIATASLKSSLPTGRVIVAGVVDEEGRGRGIKNLLRENLSVNCAIFGEPSGIRNITFAYKGHLHLKVVCKTVTGHVGAQHLIPNAIEKSFELWLKIKVLCEEKYRSPHGVFYSLTPVITRISSRSTTGSIPDICYMDIDLRLPPTIPCKKAVKIISEVIEDFKKENYGLNIGLRIVDEIEPYVADRESIVIKSLSEAIREETGSEARLIRKTGTGDMNIFGLHLKIPVATYGPGESILSHTPNENVSIQEYLASIRIYKRAVNKILRALS